MDERKPMTQSQARGVRYARELEDHLTWLDTFSGTALGVLAVAIASPCTAPFMGASLGFAVGMPAVQALTVFAALGVGMALPYVLACFTGTPSTMFGSS